VTCILGISAFYHDSAAALIVDGHIVAAAQEERFTRKKHDSAYPSGATAYCLSEAGVSLEDVSHVVFYEKPFVKFERLLETYLAHAPRGIASFRLAMPLWIKEKLFQKQLLVRKLSAAAPCVKWEERLLFSDHHLSHAASAFYPSPFDHAAVLTTDGVGEWTTTSMGMGDGGALTLHKELHFPHSLGLLYSAFTYFTGFRVNSGEYKLMGLGPYGEPRFAQLILDNLIDLKADGSFRLDISYFDYCVGLVMTNEKFARLFGVPVRQPEQDLEQIHMDIAASIQVVLEEVILRITRSLAAETGAQNLCLAGGVALNCVSNAKILRDGRFKNIWIQPAAGDAGGAIGAALAVYHIELDQPRASRTSGDGMSGAFLGPAFDDEETGQRLDAVGARYERLTDAQTIERTARALADGQAVGWFSGRMEFGPRALGGRSILADPRSPIMQRTLNLKVKYRESFRPFAPSVLREDVADWFDLDIDSPYMLLVADVAKSHRRQMTEIEDALFGIDKLNVARSDIPAVTHIDYSARVQTVHAETNPRYHALITRFKELTGCPVLVNTSFNVRGEPIVCTPDDAFRCFMGSEIDLLVIENCVLEKRDQRAELKISYAASIDPD
jgi:carbamoyltransferase